MKGNRVITRLPEPTTTASNSAETLQSFSNLLPVHPALVMFARQPRHWHFQLVLQAAHGVHHITAVHPGRCRVVGLVRKKGETRRNQEKSFITRPPNSTINWYSTFPRPNSNYNYKLIISRPFFFTKFNTMAQINSNWTAPTFSFSTADHPTAWRDFYLRATDYLETLRIQPKEEDQLKRGWEQITTMLQGKTDRYFKP